MIPVCFVGNGRLHFVSNFALNPKLCGSSKKAKIFFCFQKRILGNGNTNKSQLTLNSTRWLPTFHSRCPTKKDSSHDNHRNQHPVHSEVIYKHTHLMNNMKLYHVASISATFKRNRRNKQKVKMNSFSNRSTSNYPPPPPPPRKIMPSLSPIGKNPN